MNTPPRSVTLRFRDDAAPAQATLRPDLGADEIEQMLQQAERMGLPRHPDPATAALLAAVRVRADIPPELYAALAAVLSRVYAAGERLR
ncbi:MAG TPA: flagellar biosynthesis protein [Rhodanobacteraceae bacterium]|nr:flagellar biosynthesis protein [Oleiagrimonas sp.]HET9819557.1 flagellar biosynthesis protein [Rhodanobacteraceae bacterium]